MYGKINADGSFYKNYEVTYNNIDYNLLLKPQTATEMCQNTAVLHSDAAGYTVEYFKENHRAWVLTGWHIVFTNRPTENTTFDIKSWTRPYKRLQSDRDYIATDKDGNELFRGTSRWFLLDTEKRKPMRLPNDFFSNYIPSEIEAAIPDEDYKHADLDLYEHASTRTLKVTRRDIDTNGHTNNIAYLDWAIDDLTDDIYLNYTIVDLRAEYSQEAMLGDTVVSNFYTRQLDETTVEVTSLYTTEENPDKLLCRVTTQWIKK